LCGRLFVDRFFSCLLDEDHLYEAIRYVELNPWRAKMESEIGTYGWSSSLERLKMRSKFFLSKLPDYLRIKDWLEYLKEPIEEKVLHVKETWAAIRTFTVGGVPLGRESFIQKVKANLSTVFAERIRDLSQIRLET